MTESTKYLFPIAPKIAPTARVTLDSNSLKGIKKIKHEIKYDKNPPINNLKNNDLPSLLVHMRPPKFP